MEEIERKYLVVNDDWQKMLSTNHPQMGISQMYLVNEPDLCTRLQYRIRRTAFGTEQRAAINMKTPREGLSRTEFEIDMDPQEALWMIQKFQHKYPVIEKIRSFVDITEFMYWEIDQFKNPELEGLILAEVELPDADFEFATPSWIGDEVTYLAEYYNGNMAERLHAK